MGDRSASMPEFMPLRLPSGRYDVAILGGGLAGLSMCLHLRRQRPDARVLLVDKRTEPAREAAFKVGESSVEIGAWYYRETCGMRDHLEERQLRKHGLRFFPRGGDNGDITKRVEFCTPAHHSAYTHQIDRGVYENEMFDRVMQQGADAFRGFRVMDVEIGDPEHKLMLSHENGDVEVTARWIVDATGRGNFMRRKLGIGTETGHDINAAWFRLAGGLDWEGEWGGDNDEWLGRMPERGLRNYSTTHLVDEGYWLWLIQLASGPISIGVCADPRIHPFEEISSFDAFLDWMKEHEPQLAASVEPRRDDVLDFLRIEGFSYASEQAWSKDRWCLVGEAFGFIDALYSPGSDFIAFTNTFSGELIKMDLDGEPIDEAVDFYNDFFMKLFEPTLRLYKDNYQFFGNPQVMTAKVVYDSLTYFALLGSPFLHGRMAKIDDIKQLLAMFEDFIPLSGVMQQLFRDWHELEDTEWEGVSVLSKQFTPYIRAQEEMSLPADGDVLLERSREKLVLLQALAVWIFHKAAKNLPDGPPDEDQRIDPFAISLHPERWEQDGLFSDDGMSLAQATELLAGVGEIDLEARGAVPAPH